MGFKNIISDTTSALSESIGDAGALLKDTFSKFYDVKNITKEKLSTMANDFLALAPVIEKTGYRTKELTIGVTVPPKIIFHFEKFAEISKEEIEKILVENKNKTLLKVIVNTLVTADEFQSKLTPGSFKFSEIDIELGIPPQVNIKFINQGK
ncbi:MAG: hypothetical protein ACKVPJ_03490 [Chitinophagales bacterium]